MSFTKNKYSSISVQAVGEFGGGGSSSERRGARRGVRPIYSGVKRPAPRCELSCAAHAVLGLRLLRPPPGPPTQGPRSTGCFAAPAGRAFKALSEFQTQQPRSREPRPGPAAEERGAPQPPRQTRCFCKAVKMLTLRRWRLDALSPRALKCTRFPSLN